MAISKSKYLRYCQCPKILWLERYKNISIEKKQEKLLLYNPNTIIDKLSVNLFNSQSACEYYDTENEKMNFKAMAKKTAKLIEDVTCKTIHKATFEFENSYFILDIIKKVKRGYIVYLVKASKSLRQNFLKEMAYLGYILQKINVPVYRYCVITINSNYERCGELELKKYFKINYVGTKIKPFLENVQSDLEQYKQMIEIDKEPNIEYGVQCSSSHPCPYVEYCRKPLPIPSVFDLYGFNKKIEMYKKNILSFEDVLKNNIKLSEFQKRQIDFSLNSLPTFVDKENLCLYLKRFRYPLYFLDFETTQQEIPLYDGIKPFEQIPFQYSLHYILNEGGELQHSEYLANEDEDPRIKLVEKLVKEIPTDSCIIAYNEAFEKNVLRKLAEDFPEYREHLLKLTENFIDLIIPFEKGYVYDKLMGGSFSLKSVLPALFPDDPELNYGNLEDVHNGRDARMLFPALKFMEEDERNKERENLLKYCFLDTYAMVKIWQKLKEFLNT